MLFELLQQMKRTCILLLLFTVLTGLIYPAVVMGFAQLLFPWKANGSLIEENGKLVGSRLIGQSFTGNQYFWGRPSATSPFPYNAVNSSGSNLAPSNPNLLSIVNARVAQLHQADPQNKYLIPVDLVTASGSGLDPEISPLAAFYQVHRVAKARNLPEIKLQMLVNDSIKNCSLSILGEPRVNVLELNLAVNRITANTNKVP